MLVYNRDIRGEKLVKSQVSDKRVKSFRDEDNVLHIGVKYEPDCTWELRGRSFFCTHDINELETLIEEYMGINGIYTSEYEARVCTECEEELENTTQEELDEYLAEMKLMELLGK